MIADPSDVLSPDVILKTRWSLFHKRVARDSQGTPSLPPPPRNKPFELSSADYSRQNSFRSPADAQANSQSLPLQKSLRCLLRATGSPSVENVYR
jgi:hypothetical protein